MLLDIVHQGNDQVLGLAAGRADEDPCAGVDLAKQLFLGQKLLWKSLSPVVPVNFFGFYLRIP